MRTFLIALTCICAGLSLMVSTAHAAPSATDAFAQLKALTGQWKASTKRGPIAVSFHMTAADTVLVETFKTPSGRTSLTLYHLDGAQLVATHYCPQGNQPRLQWLSTSTGGLDFGFRDATNLKTGAAHLHSMRIERVNADTMKKIETYQSAGKPDTSTLVFTRHPTP